MLTAYAPTFWDVVWWMCIFFLWVLFIYLVIVVFMDNFKRTDHGGWAKATWTLFIIFLPFLGICIYLIARPKEPQPA
jgi:hypothetical protein